MSSTPSQGAKPSAFRSLFLCRLPIEQRDAVDQFGQLLYNLTQAIPRSRDLNSIHDRLLAFLTDLRDLEACLARLGIDLELSEASDKERALCRFAQHESRVLRNINQRLVIRLRSFSEP
jgi:hypothetical protein